MQQKSNPRKSLTASSTMPSLQHPVRQISKTTVRAPPLDPAAPPPPSRCEMTAWDLAMLSVHYIQKGHLFSIPSISTEIDDILRRLTSSLSLTLLHFYPLAGRFATTTAPSGGLHTYIDCSNEGADLIHAVADGVSVSDVLAPNADVPPFVRWFFPHDSAVNHDGHTIPFLSVQVTQLVDGIFLGCAFNHAVGDGNSFWMFYNAWAETCRTGRTSRTPLHDRCFLGGRKAPILLPDGHPDEYIERFAPPPLRERIFHFSADSIAKLKARANRECNTENKISSFQALSALVWRSITRHRHFPETQDTSCRLATENRSRLRPQLSPDYFGNSIYALRTTTTVGELMAHDLGWTAMLLHRSIAAHSDEAIRGAVAKWTENPVVYQLSKTFDRHSVMMGSSPRFDMYGCEFGWGKAVALRSGSANKFDGKVSSYPGREGGGSIDLEVCLVPETMAALEHDEEFMGAVTPV